MRAASNVPHKREVRDIHNSLIRRVFAARFVHSLHLVFCRAFSLPARLLVCVASLCQRKRCHPALAAVHCCHTDC